MERKGRILEIADLRARVSEVVTGIRSDKQPYYNRRYDGANGTYAVQHRTFGGIMLKILLYDAGQGCDEEVLQVEVTDEIRTAYGGTRISAQRVRKLKEKLEGKKVKCQVLGGGNTVFFPKELFMI